MGQRSDPPWALLIAWMIVPATEAWLHLAAAPPPVFVALAVEALVFLWLGVALPRLRSWRIPSHPIWVLVVPVLLAALQVAPRDLRVLPYGIGLVVLIVGPAVLLARRVRTPWWVVALCAPVLVVLLQPREAARLLPEPPLPAGTDAGPPVIVISVDTLRADAALQMVSHARLAAGGAWWPSAMSTSSWTLPALASLQTGLPPGVHGAGSLPGGHFQGLDPDVATLADTLAGAGYTAVGISTNPWAGRNNGLHRGFHRFHDLGTDPWPPLLASGSALLPHPQDAEVAVDLALRTLDELGDRRSFYLWLHLIDPHLPYVHAADPALRALDVQGLRNADVLTEQRRQEIRDAYAGEVAHADAHLVRFLDALEARGLLREAVVVFTSDHGEELWEHGGVEHGHSHHAEVVEVPLVIRGPGVAPGRRSGTASIADVSGTVLAAVGLGEADVDLRRPVPPGRIATAQGNLHHELACSARDEGTRVIAHGCGQGRLDAWDLHADPAELRPFDPEPGHPVRRAAEAVAVPGAREASQQDTDALKALGYIE